MNLINDENKKYLLNLVIQTIETKLAQKALPDIDWGREGSSQELKQNLGAFVSLYIQGQLRGCIGTFQGRRNLFNTIQEMAILAAFNDFRFPPVSKTELPDLEVEISVLSPLKRVKKVEEIQVGEHGIYITLGPQSGVLLPQVATRYKWDRETFLAETCRKAGIPSDSWRSPQAVIEIFSAEIFDDKNNG